MILTDPAIVADPSGYVLEQTKILLQNAFTTPFWQAKFPGAPLVTDSAVQAFDWINKDTKRPFCVLEITSCNTDREFNERGRWLVEISIESCTLSASSTVERQLKAAVISILEGAFDHLNILGIEESNAGTDGQTTGSLPERINPAFLSAAIHVAAPATP